MRCEFKEYFESLQELFGPASLSILMLKTIAVLYPALSFVGVSLEAPLLVVVQSERQLRSLFETLQGYGRQVMKSLAAPPKEIRKALTEATYNLVFFRFAPGRYLLENLEQLTEWVSEIDFSTPSNSLLIIIFAIGGIPARCFDNMAGAIYIQGEGPMEASIETLPEIERPLILHWLQNGGQHLLSQNGESFDIFRTSAAFLVDFLRISGYGEEELGGYEEAFEEKLKELDATWDLSGNPEDYVDAFHEALFGAVNWMPRPILNRKKVEGIAIKDLRFHIYFDEHFYFLPLTLFETLCEALVGDSGIEQVKGMLADAGFLISGTGSSGRSYFTAKVEIGTAMGYRGRLRMVKLARNKVDHPGELSFKEAMETKGGGFDD